MQRYGHPTLNSCPFPPPIHQEQDPIQTPVLTPSQAAKQFQLVPDVDWSDTPTALSKLRQMTSGVSFTGLSDPDVIEESVDCPTRDGHFLELRVHRAATFSPVDAKPDSPLVVLFHGGHHALGFPGTLSGIAGSVAKRFNAVVVSAGYRLAPEHPFPKGLEDAWDVVEGCGKNAVGTLYAEPSKGFVVGGVSSGGSMSVVLAHMARDKSLSPPITGVYLASASIRAPDNSPAALPTEYQSKFLSRTQPECLASPVMPQPMADFMDALYAADPLSPLYAPLAWPAGHADLPRTYLQVCGVDPSRDENLIFEDMLKREGVPTRLELYEGLPHTFWVLFPGLAQAGRWKEDTLRGFQWLLQGGA